ncbi:transforming acidic coiled-coil protein isoform X2 [Lycorma delicatula]|uniref:transforming acidic coiled-coil protein isoform X2 n=1 Tax=Lycorma delicatula TaxID=130591 RepID=UPI003F519DE2
MDSSRSPLKDYTNVNLIKPFFSPSAKSGQLSGDQISHESSKDKLATRVTEKNLGKSTSQQTLTESSSTFSSAVELSYKEDFDTDGTPEYESAGENEVPVGQEVPSAGNVTLLANEFESLHIATPKPVNSEKTPLFTINIKEDYSDISSQEDDDCFRDISLDGNSSTATVNLNNSTSLEHKDASVEESFNHSLAKFGDPHVVNLGDNLVDSFSVTKEENKETTSELPILNETETQTLDLNLDSNNKSLLWELVEEGVSCDLSSSLSCKNREEKASEVFIGKEESEQNINSTLQQFIEDTNSVYDDNFSNNVECLFNDFKCDKVTDKNLSQLLVPDPSNKSVENLEHNIQIFTEKLYVGNTNLKSNENKEVVEVHNEINKSVEISKVEKDIQELSIEDNLSIQDLSVKSEHINIKFIEESVLNRLNETAVITKLIASAQSVKQVVEEKEDSVTDEFSKLSVENVEELKPDTSDIINNSLIHVSGDAVVIETGVESENTEQICSTNKSQFNFEEQTDHFEENFVKEFNESGIRQQDIKDNEKSSIEQFTQILPVKSDSFDKTEINFPYNTSSLEIHVKSFDKSEIIEKVYDSTGEVSNIVNKRNSSEPGSTSPDVASPFKISLDERRNKFSSKSLDSELTAEETDFNKKTFSVFVEASPVSKVDDRIDELTSLSTVTEISVKTAFNCSLIDSEKEVDAKCFEVVDSSDSQPEVVDIFNKDELNKESYDVLVNEKNFISKAAERTDAESLQTLISDISEVTSPLKTLLTEPGTAYTENGSVVLSDYTTEETQKETVAPIETGHQDKTEEITCELVSSPVEVTLPTDTFFNKSVPIDKNDVVINKSESISSKIEVNLPTEASSINTVHNDKTDDFVSGNVECVSSPVVEVKLSADTSSADSLLSDKTDEIVSYNIKPVSLPLLDIKLSTKTSLIDSVHSDKIDEIIRSDVKHLSEVVENNSSIKTSQGLLEVKSSKEISLVDCIQSDKTDEIIKSNVEPLSTPIIEVNSSIKTSQALLEVKLPAEPSLKEFLHSDKTDETIKNNVQPLSLPIVEVYSSLKTSQDLQEVKLPTETSLTDLIHNDKTNEFIKRNVEPLSLPAVEIKSPVKTSPTSAQEFLFETIDPPDYKINSTETVSFTEVREEKNCNFTEISRVKVFDNCIIKSSDLDTESPLNSLEKADKTNVFENHSEIVNSSVSELNEIVTEGESEKEKCIETNNSTNISNNVCNVDDSVTISSEAVLRKDKTEAVLESTSVPQLINKSFSEEVELHNSSKTDNFDVNSIEFCFDESLTAEAKKVSEDILNSSKECDIDDVCSELDNSLVMTEGISKSSSKSVVVEEEEESVTMFKNMPSNNFQNHCINSVGKIIQESASVNSNSDVNKSEAGPVTAEEEYQSADLYQFDLDYLGQAGHNTFSSNLTRQSLYVKFDPLVGQVLANTEESHCISNESEVAVCEESVPVLRTPMKNPPLDDGKLISLTPSGPSHVTEFQTNKSEAAAAETDDELSGDSNILDNTVQENVVPSKTLMKNPSTDKKTHPSTSSSTPQDKEQSTPRSGPRTVVSQEVYHKEMQKLQDLMAKQDQMYKDELKSKSDHIEKLEKKIEKLQCEMGEKESKTQKELQKLEKEKKSKQQLGLILEEYERTISQLLAQKEEEKKQFESQKETIMKERDTAMTHLNNLEIAFNDVHQKYERSKTVIEGMKNNEDLLKNSLQTYEGTLKKQEDKYNKLRSHAMAQLEKANEELDLIKRNHEAEVAKLKAMVKKSEIRAASLEEALERKKKENTELTQICDELISRVSGN